MSLPKVQSQPDSCTMSPEEQRKQSARMNRRSRQQTQEMKPGAKGSGILWSVSFTVFCGIWQSLMGCSAFQSLGK